MQALNSTGYSRKTLVATGVGMFFAFLLLAPFASFGAGTLTVKTGAASYAVGATIAVSGTVSPAPGVSGENVAVSILTPNGALADANQFPINSATGAFNGTFVPGPSYTPQGTFTVKAVAPGNLTASATFVYGNATTSTSATGGGVTTTIISATTTVITQITTVSAGGATTTVIQPGTTVTSIVTTATTVNNNTTTTASDSTALAIGAVGLIIAIVAIVLAVLTMRKK